MAAGGGGGQRDATTLCQPRLARRSPEFLQLALVISLPPGVLSVVCTCAAALYGMKHPSCFPPAQHSCYWGSPFPPRPMVGRGRGPPCLLLVCLSPARPIPLPSPGSF